MKYVVETGLLSHLQSLYIAFNNLPSPLLQKFLYLTLRANETVFGKTKEL